MLRQHAPAFRVDLAKRHRFEPIGILEPDTEPADPAEQVEYFELIHGAAPSRLRIWKRTSFAEMAMVS